MKIQEFQNLLISTQPPQIHISSIIFLLPAVYQGYLHMYIFLLPFKFEFFIYIYIHIYTNMCLYSIQFFFSIQFVILLSCSFLPLGLVFLVRYYESGFISFFATPLISLFHTNFQKIKVRKRQSMYTQREQCFTISSEVRFSRN